MRMLREILIIAMLACPCLARVITVDNDGPADFSNIQAAIDASVNGDTVVIQPGIYTGTGNWDITFISKIITVTSTDPNDPCAVAATVVDGGGSAAGSHRGFIFRGAGANSTLRGVTIANFYVSDRSGAGIYSSNSSPTIEKCVIRDNQCSFYNYAVGEYGGGGFYLLFGSPKFNNCVIKGNTAVYYGGGGTCEVVDPCFTGCVFEDNYAQLAGGLCAFDGKATLDNCTFVRNRNYNDGDNGGYVSPAALYLYIEHSGTVVRNCLFTGNMGLGGTVLNESCSPTYDSCIFVGNFTGYEGAVWNWGNGNIPANSVFLRCTIANNTGEFNGGMRNENANNENSSPTVSHCILWGNSPPDMYTQSGSPRISYTCMGTWPDGLFQGSVIVADPLFVNMAAGDVHLRPGSPCINAGDPNIHYTGQKDLDGNPRVMGGRVDIGPYEYWFPPRTIYVDANAAGANNGTNWANAYRYLQDAMDINKLSYGDRVRVAQGVYKPDRGAHVTSGDRLATFQLPLGVTVEGGYAGFGAADPNKRDVGLYKTFLSGDLLGNDANDIPVTQLLTASSRSENSSHVVDSSGVDANTVLDGFIIEKGNATGPILKGYYGAGMYNNAGYPTIKNCTFRLNSSQRPGGAIYNDYGGISKLVNCRITGNYDLDTGGGSYGKTVLINCDIYGNCANICGGAYAYSALTMKNCVLWGNSDRNGITEASQVMISSGSVAVDYSCIQGWTGALGGSGNFCADPLFVDPNNTDLTKWDFHLLPDSLCIDAGEPNSSWEAEPWPNGARVNTGSYGNTSEAAQSRNGLQLAGFDIVDKTRIGRTLYRYILSLSLTNTANSDMTNVYVKLIDASEQVTKVIDGDIFFPQIRAGSTADSNILGELFIIEIDRSKLIIPGRLTWQVDYTRSGVSQMQLMSAAFPMENNLVAGDISGDGIVDFLDIQALAEQWLRPPAVTSADIGPEQDGDGVVDWLDFAVLANNWTQ